MPNRQGIITGGASTGGFNDGSVRGYPLWLALSTRQVSDVVHLDEDILRPKGGRHVKADWGSTLDHNHEPQLGPWSVPKHGGLKEFIDHVIKCLRLGADQSSNRVSQRSGNISSRRSEARQIQDDPH